MSRSTLVLAISIALHGVAGVVLTFAAPAMSRTRNTAITVDVRRVAPPPPPAPLPVEPTPPPPTPAPSAPPPSAVASLTPRSKQPPPRLPSVELRPPDKDPSGSGGNAVVLPAAPVEVDPNVKPPTDPAKVNLFSSSAFNTVVGTPSPDSRGGMGGTTRRAGDGKGLLPGERDARADREEASHRIRGWMAEATGAEAVKSGNVAPVWRDIERQIDTSFHPSIAAVTEEPMGKSLLKRIFMNAPPKTGPAGRSGIDPSADPNSARYDQMMAGQNNSASVTAGPRTEIEVIVDSNGELVSAKVSMTSGRARFDSEALAAVKKAILQHPARDPKGKMLAKFAVSASLKVGGPMSAGFGFEETTGKFSGAYPFKRDVKTTIQLISVAPLQD